MPELQLTAPISEAVDRVLDLMCFTAVVGPANTAAATPSLEYASLVGFRGPRAGAVAVGISGAGARVLAANFIGAEDRVEEERIVQFVGELSNMLCGSVISALPGAGQYELLPPQVASPHAPEFSSGTRADFELEEGILTVAIHFMEA
jgi:CheY-specific phosphatase CheX